MAVFNGTELALYTVGSPGNKKIAKATSNDLALTIATIDVSTKDSAGWKESLGGQRGYSFSVEGIVDFQVSTSTMQGAKEIFQMGIDRTAVVFVFKNSEAGDTAYQGSGILTNVQIGAPVEGAVTFTADIEGTGPLTPSTIV